MGHSTFLGLNLESFYFLGCLNLFLDEHPSQRNACVPPPPWGLSLFWISFLFTASFSPRLDQCCICICQLQLHGEIYLLHGMTYHPDSFSLMLLFRVWLERVLCCANLKVIRYGSILPNLAFRHSLPKQTFPG